MPFSPLHREVAAIVLDVAARYGFVLGGGNALILHGIVERPTNDVDVMTNLDDGVKAATGAVEDALRAAGFTVERQNKEAGGLSEVFYGFDMGLVEWIVTSPSGERTVLQISRFDRNRSPVIMDVGPVLNLEDALALKVSAMATRAEERDFVDVAAALDRYSADELIGLAQQLDPGLEHEDFADAGRQLDQLPDQLFARYGLGPEDVARLRERFVSWPRS
jgi:predicted nucleotidyltransferase component of viral defense system